MPTSRCPPARSTTPASACASSRWANSPTCRQLRDLVVDSQWHCACRDIAEVILQAAAHELRAAAWTASPAVGLDIYKERSANLVELSRQRAGAKSRRMQQRSGDARDQDRGHRQPGRGRHRLADWHWPRPAASACCCRSPVLFFFLRHWPSTLMVTTGDPDLLRDDAGLHVFRRHHPQHPVDDGPAAGGGHAGRQRGGRGREHLPGTREDTRRSRGWRRSIGTRHVAIALSAGTLCHCIVFLPKLFGETNMISIYLAQIAVTISVSLLASWLVAISLIPMLSARMQTPPAVNVDRHDRALQSRYASVLRWTLEHRGWSVLGIVLIIGVEHRADEAHQGRCSATAATRARSPSTTSGRASYTKEADGRGSRQGRGTSSMPIASASTSTRSIADTASRAGRRPGVTFDAKSTEESPRRSRTTCARTCRSRRAPTSASVGQGGMGRRRQGHPVQPDRRLHRRRWRSWPTTSSRSCRGGKELRDVRVDTGDAEQRAAGARRIASARPRSASARSRWRSSSAWRCAARRCASSAAATSKCRSTCASPVPSSSARKTWPAFTVRAPDGRTVPLLAMVDVGVTPSATADPAHEPADHADDRGRPRRGRRPCRKRARRSRTRSRRMQFPPGYSYTFEGGGFGIRHRGAGSRCCSTWSSRWS